MAKEPVIVAVLYRWMGERQVTGYYVGVPLVNVVTVQRTLRLTANTQDQLDHMVNVASVDGWRANSDT